MKSSSIEIKKCSDIILFIALCSLQNTVILCLCFIKLIFSTIYSGIIEIYYWKFFKLYTCQFSIYGNFCIVYLYKGCNEIQNFAHNRLKSCSF